MMLCYILFCYLILYYMFQYYMLLYHTYIHTYIYTYVSIYIYTCVCVCVCLCVCLCVCVDLLMGWFICSAFTLHLAHVMPQVCVFHLAMGNCAQAPWRVPLPSHWIWDRKAPGATTSTGKTGTVPAVSCLARQNSLYESVFL
jgi:hypothetical protein